MKNETQNRGYNNAPILRAILKNIEKTDSIRGGKMIQEIYIIDDDESSILVFRELFKDDKE